VPYELHPDTEKYYALVRRYLEERGLWEKAVKAYARGRPDVAGINAIKEAVSRILDRCEHAQTDPQLLDWGDIASFIPLHDTARGLLQDLQASGKIPGPSPEEADLYAAEREREAREFISRFEELPPDLRRALVEEILSRTDQYRALVERARRTGKLEAEVRRLRRRLAESEAKLKELREQLRGPPKPPPPAPPPPKPEWETRLERYRADYFSKARTWIELFMPRDKRRAMEEEARRLWREYEVDVAEACRARRYELAEQRLRELEQELAKQILTVMPRNKASALAYFQEQGIIPKEEAEALARTLPPEAVPPGYEETPYAPRVRRRPVPAVAYWAHQPIPVIADSPNPWERAFGLPTLRKMGMIVELHVQTYGALVKMAELVGAPRPASSVMTVEELKRLVDTIRSKTSHRGDLAWLDKLLERLEAG
jgi:DNA-directed RNA polymerase subunit F